MEEGPFRKLAVLLHADVVGSTGLVQLNEALAHERIQDAFRRFSATIRAYGGTAHELRGDALVAEFGRASDAVCAAVAFQRQNSGFNTTLDDEIRPRLRVGIGMGEVVIADNTITGEGVVLAQRLEQIAEPGGVCIQGAAYETVPKRLPFHYENLGEQALKGFEETVRAYGVTLKAGGTIPAPESVSQSAAPTLELPEEPSLAVLPFANMSGDPEQEYFSDGITEDIITALSRISGLLVVARNSTMIYKDKSVDAKQIGQEQGVRYVLEGSVRKAGNRVRVTAQLIDATTGHHQWADRYDRNLDDVFAVQDDITHQITVEMRVQFKEGEQARMLAGRTDSVEAWERTLRAEELNNRHIKEDNLEARRLAEEALRIDPCFASAWMELGWTHWEDAYWGWTDSREHSVAEALAAAQKALELEKDYPSALGLLGHIYLLRGEHDRAVEVTERAVALAPNHAEITALLGVVLTFAGKADEAVAVFKRAMRLSPIYPAWYLVNLGTSYHSMNEQDLAISTLQEAVVMEPGSVNARVWLTSALIEAGLVEDAKRVAREVMRIDRHFSVANLPGVTQFKDAALNERIIENLLNAGLPE